MPSVERRGGRYEWTTRSRRRKRRLIEEAAKQELKSGETIEAVGEAVLSLGRWYLAVLASPGGVIALAGLYLLLLRRFRWVVLTNERFLVRRVRLGWPLRPGELLVADPRRAWYGAKFDIRMGQPELIVTKQETGERLVLDFLGWEGDAVAMRDALAPHGDQTG